MCSGIEVLIAQMGRLNKESPKALGSGFSLRDFALKSKAARSLPPTIHPTKAQKVYEIWVLLLQKWGGGEVRLGTYIRYYTDVLLLPQPFLPAVRTGGGKAKTFRTVRRVRSKQRVPGMVLFLRQRSKEYDVLCTAPGSNNVFFAVTKTSTIMILYY